MIRIDEPRSMSAWMLSMLMYGEGASSPPRSWPFDRALEALLGAIEGSTAWRTWWQTSDQRPLQVWVDVLTSSDLRNRLAGSEISDTPRVRRSSKTVRVECALDVEVARTGSAELQRASAKDFVTDVMHALATSLGAQPPPQTPEPPPASSLEQSPFLAAHRAKLERRRKGSKKPGEPGPK